MDDILEGKILQRIMIAIEKQYYSDDTMNILLDGNNYILKKIGYIGNQNIYDIECHNKISCNSVKFKICDKINSSYYIHRGFSIIPEDIGYNHINEICHTNLFDPKPDQYVYSIGIPAGFCINIFVKKEMH